MHIEDMKPATLCDS